MEDSIVIEKKENIAILKIQNPKSMNALSREIVNKIDSCLDEIEKDTEIKVLVITGENNFAAGADITEMVEISPEEARSFSFCKTFEKLENLKIPTIAAIYGYALGGGLELALACDLRIASEDAQLGLPEINLGIMPGAGGTVRLPRLIGEAKAKELIFLGGRLSASEAYHFGMVNKVEKAEILMEETLKLAEKLANKSSTALCAAKESINNSFRFNSTDALKKESEIWSGLFLSHDQKEGMRAFLEKRKPIYKKKQEGNL